MSSSWSECTRCPLHRTRRKMVYGKGSIPAPLLLIGEAPGMAEDALGEPFVGPAGIILRTVIKEAARFTSRKEVPIHYITNVVACRPCNSKHDENREPTPEEIAACQPRLLEILKRVKPTTVVLMGKVAQRAAYKLCKERAQTIVKVKHPAFVARQGGVGCPEYRILRRSLADVFEGLTR